MKILIINKFLYPNGGSETYIFKLGAALKQQGHEVQYFGMEHKGRCVENSVQMYTTDMDFHGGSKLAKLTYPIKTIYSFEARKKLRLVLEDFKPDVCHLNNFNFQLTPSIILEIRQWEKETHSRVKIVATAHDGQLVCPNHLMQNPNTGKVCDKCLGGHFLNCIAGRCIHGSAAKSMVGAAEGWYWNLRKVYREIDVVISPSAFLAQKLRKNQAIADRIVVLRNFVYLPEVEHPEEKGDYVLFFGRFSHEKGINTLLKVVDQLPGIPFVFAGDGPLADQVNRRSNIANKGFLTGQTLQKVIAGARLTVVPSECYENCPFSVMESQMCGTPVLGANIGGIPELICEGQTGELFESGSPEDLKEHIQNLWEQKNLTDQYSRNCKNISFDSLEKYTEKMLCIYQE